MVLSICAARSASVSCWPGKKQKKQSAQFASFFNSGRPMKAVSNPREESFGKFSVSNGCYGWNSKMLKMLSFSIRCSMVLCCTLRNRRQLVGTLLAHCTIILGAMAAMDAFRLQNVYGPCAFGAYDQRNLEKLCISEGLWLLWLAVLLGNVYMLTTSSHQGSVVAAERNRIKWVRWVKHNLENSWEFRGISDGLSTQPFVWEEHWMHVSLRWCSVVLHGRSWSFWRWLWKTRPAPGNIGHWESLACQILSRHYERNRSKCPPCAR